MKIVPLKQAAANKRDRAKAAAQKRRAEETLKAKIRRIRQLDELCDAIIIRTVAMSPPVRRRMRMSSRLLRTVVRPINTQMIIWRKIRWMDTTRASSALSTASSGPLTSSNIRNGQTSSRQGFVNGHGQLDAMEEINIKQEIDEEPTEEMLEEEMVVLPDGVIYGGDEVVDAIEIPAPSPLFIDICNRLNPSEMSDPYRVEVWKQYYRISQQVLLEGDQRGWIACSLYFVMANTVVSKRPNMRMTRKFPYSVHAIIEACGISTLEFFDKLNRWLDILSASRRMVDFARKIQDSLAVSAVVFKKLLPVYRRLFLLVTEDEATVKPHSMSSQSVFALIWTMFITMRRSLPADDLLSAFHLLLCVIEDVYKSMCKTNEEHINPDYANYLLERRETVLESLCVTFEGVMLDAKHFKVHVYEKRVDSILDLDGSADFATNYELYMNKWNAIYSELMLKKSEVDERIFIPRNVATVFDPAFDASAIEILRRGSDNTSFADAELLLRMATQNCLERINEDDYQPAPGFTKSYTISSDQLCMLTPLSATIANPSKLNHIVKEFDFEKSTLKTVLDNLEQSPLDEIVQLGRRLSDKFESLVKEEELAQPNFDSSFTRSISRHKELIYTLYLVLVEKIIVAERDRTNQPLGDVKKEADYASMFRRPDLLKSLFGCALELLIYSYESAREFPWSLKITDLAPITFHKIIESVVSSADQLTRDMVKHLNKVEERIVEQFAWSVDSPIWPAISRSADAVPTWKVAWKTERNPGIEIDDSFSAAKKRILATTNMLNGNAAAFKYKQPVLFFFKRVYYICCTRLTDLCERCRIDEFSKNQIWTLMCHIIRHENSLLCGRHLDQNIMCAVYIIAKVNRMELPFLEIMSHYRHQPQANSAIYRDVPIETNLDSPSPCSDDGNSRDSVSTATTQGSTRLRSDSTIPVPGVSSAPPTPELVPSQSQTNVNAPSTSSASTTKTSLEGGSVNVSSQERTQKVDIIKYYNMVFRPRVEEFVKRMERDDPQITIHNLPVPKGFGLSPIKKCISDRVLIQPLAKSSLMGHPERVFKFNMMVTSPRKDLRDINRIVGSGTVHQSTAQRYLPHAAGGGVIYKSKSGL